MLDLLLQDGEHSGRRFVPLAPGRNSRCAYRHAIAEQDGALGLDVYDEEHRTGRGDLRCPNEFARTQANHGLDD